MRASDWMCLAMLCLGLTLVACSDATDDELSAAAAASAATTVDDSPTQTTNDAGDREDAPLAPASPHAAQRPAPAPLADGPAQGQGGPVAGGAVASLLGDTLAKAQAGQANPTSPADVDPSPAASTTSTAASQPAATRGNASGGTSGGASGGASGGGVVFVEHKLHDPGMNNAHSHTLLIPEGWRTEGGVVRPGAMLFNMPVAIDLKVIAPDGRQARILPTMSFEFFPSHEARPWQPLQTGNLYMPLPQSAGQWLLEQARANPEQGVTDIQLVSETVDEQLTAQLRQQAAPVYQGVAQTNQYAATTGVGAAFDTQAQSVTLSYRTADGQAMQETYLICWYANLTLMQGQVHSGFWGVTLMLSVRDRAGRDPVNDPVLLAIFRSLRPTSAWQAEMNRYWAELAHIRQRGRQVAQSEAAKRSAIISKNYSDINDIITTGWKNRQASSDRIQQRTIDSIHEVTPYRTPAGETVRLPSYYNHVYTDGQGRYLLNNDANYNPNLDPSLNNRSWDAMQQAQ